MQGSNCKKGLRAVKITSFSVHLPNQTFEKECWFKLNQTHNFFQVSTPKSIPSPPRPLYFLQCEMFHMSQEETFLENVNIWQIQTQKARKFRETCRTVAKGLFTMTQYTIHSYVLMRKFIPRHVKCNRVCSTLPSDYH